MKNLRLLLPSLLLTALTATGCFLVSGQFLVSINLDPTLTVNSAASINGLEIDLRTNSTYNDHKEKIKDIADFALIGTVENNLGSELRLDVYLVDGPETGLSLSQILSTGTKVWGTLVVPANATKRISWNESAALFGSGGKAALLAQVKGDGFFTLYAVSSTAPFSFDFNNGVFVAVLAAGT